MGVAGTAVRHRRRPHGQRDWRLDAQLYDLLVRRLRGGAGRVVGRGLPQLIVVLGVTGDIGGSRLIRGAVIDIKEHAYFQAVEVIGTSKWGTFIRHVLPNIMPVVIIIFSINVGGAIIAEASLSFLGFGLSVGVPSWGAILSREGRECMHQTPWLALWPGVGLTIVVYCLNMLGDALRDLLDPRLRGGGGRLGTDGSRSV